MPRAIITPVLIAHGGAGGRPPASDRASRRHGILAAVQRGADILRGGGSALDAVVATVVALEDDPLFNAGYGSVLTTAGHVEMDAAVMTATRPHPHDDPASIINQARWVLAPAGPGRAPADAVEVNAGGVVLVSRVRNPIVLARAVMERTPHLLLGGPGAERHCVFSTGAFVEPIEIWDEPRQLKFSVTSNPAPMQEWTPYSHIDPPHLQGFLVSNGGQFLLTPLPNGATRVEGTTWYRHGLWPTAYWRIWSDAIIHRIHMRVLKHIRDEAENNAP